MATLNDLIALENLDPAAFDCNGSGQITLSPSAIEDALDQNGDGIIDNLTVNIPGVNTYTRVFRTLYTVTRTAPQVIDSPLTLDVSAFDPIGGAKAAILGLYCSISNQLGINGASVQNKLSFGGGSSTAHYAGIGSNGDTAPSSFGSNTIIQVINSGNVVGNSYISIQLASVAAATNTVTLEGFIY
jgi:hypothetical protein